MCLRVRYRSPDWNRRISIALFAWPICTVDDCLSRPIDVVQLGPGATLELRDAHGRQGLAAAHHGTQGQGVIERGFLDEQPQKRRNAVKNRDSFSMNYLCYVSAIPMTVGFCYY